jgi:Domain of unknown function (DUF4911)
LLLGIVYKATHERGEQMESDKRSSDVFAPGAQADGPPDTMASMLIWIPPAMIALFKAIIESYDNLATMRTEDPSQHHLRLYFAPESSGEVQSLIDSLTEQFSIRRVA